MIDDIPSALATYQGERAFVREVHALVRADRFDDAEARLFAFLAGCGDPIAQSAMTLRPDRVEIDWDEVNRFLTSAGAEGKRVTAIGLDFSNHADSEDGEPGAEVSLYPDWPYRFSGATRARLLAATEEGRDRPWVGGFEHIKGLALQGFAPLNRTLVKLRRGGIRTECVPGSAAHAAYVCAWLLIGLRFHQLVAGNLRSRGLSRRVPVLVGGNEETYVADSAYFPEAIEPPRPKPQPGPREKAEQLAEGVRMGVRRHFPAASGPLTDLGIGLLAQILVDRRETRKTRRRRERGG